MCGTITMAQRRLRHVTTSMLNLYQVFHNLGMQLFSPHHPQHHTSSCVYGLSLARSGHLWQVYGGVGPLLRLKEGCHMLAH